MKTLKDVLIECAGDWGHLIGPSDRLYDFADHVAYATLLFLSTQRSLGEDGWRVVDDELTTLES